VSRDRSEPHDAAQAIAGKIASSDIQGLNYDTGLNRSDAPVARIEPAEVVAAWACGLDGSAAV
jgi:hypothetical protein